MEVRKIIFVVLLLCFPFGLLKSQSKYMLSNNVENTVNEIRGIYSSLSQEQKERAEGVVLTFTQMWNELDSEGQKGFIELSNLLLSKKMSPIPHLANMIDMYAAYAQTNQSLKSGQNFVKGIKYCIVNSPNQFNNVTHTYQTFLTDYIFNTYTGSRWCARDLDLFYFDFDSLPKIVIPKLTLVAENGKDSLLIKNSSGAFYPISLLFVGEKGVTDWEKTGLGQGVYATYQNYRIILKAPNVEIDNVLYHNPAYFSKGQLGRLEDKVMTTEVSQENASYPRFTSYAKDIRIDNIAPEVDYLGGVQVRGAKFFGSGDAQQMAQLIFKRENREVVRAQSSSFLLKNDQIASQMCQVSVFIDSDSITHSAIALKYTPQKREMWLIRGQDGSQRMPFSDTYHKIEIYVEALHWNLKEENIEFSSQPGPVGSASASFESINFFTQSRLDEMMGMNEINPMFTLYEFFRKRKTRTADIDEIVAYFKYGKSDVQTLIFQMAQYGFVDYNMLTNEVIYHTKLGNYLQNELKKKDYDILQFHSNVNQGESNATLSLLNFDLNINGVDLIIVSDSQIVNILPTEKKITMQKNRDFLFHGKVEAGLFDFWVTNAKFNYDPFTMDFVVVDSMVFYVEDKNKGANAMGEYPLEKVRSYISDISGTLYIDQSNNKSSTLSIPGYPYFEASSPGKVYYDHSFVYGGAYDRERFYFQTDKFTIKNLDDYDTDSLLFTGYLNSGGIFPEITEPLKVRPDYSLGFVYNTSPSELPAYGGVGEFSGKIDLSNKGLRCTGGLDYVQSHAEGKQMLFFLDSMIADFDTYRIDEQYSGTQYPSVMAENSKAQWLPYQDEMQVNNERFTMYNDARLNGQLLVSSKGVKGSGEFKYDIAIMRSEEYDFLHHEITSNSLEIDFYDESSDDYYMQAVDQKAHVDLEKQKGNFIANEGLQPVDFPINMFKTYSKEFDWLIGEKKLQFKYEDPYIETDLNQTPVRELYALKSTGNELISTNPAQKELQFTATSATYDFVKYHIKAEGVRFIEVADAAIFPKDGIVDIYRRAEIAPLKDAKILTNTMTQYHELFKSSVSLESRDFYKGNGYYNYVDSQKIIQEIYLDSIWVNRENLTRAVGSIAEEACFKLNPHFGYSGKVELNAENRFLTMKGYVTLMYSCDTNKYAPIRFQGGVNPDSVMIPITETTRDSNNRPVVAAIASNASGQIYPAFARAKDAINNPEYLRAYGYLTYKEELESYLVAELDKIQNLDLPGNIVYLDRKNCIVRGEGRLDLGTNFGRMEFVPMGSVTNFMQNDSAVVNISASMDFYFNNECMTIMANELEKASLEGIDIVETKSYQTALLEILGSKEYESAYAELAQYYHFRHLPKALQLAFVFADIEMEWKQENKVFVSVGNIGLAICGGKEINKYVPGLMEIQKKSTNKSSNNKTSFQLYLELDESVWFYFNYSGTTMQALSSVKEFNEIIKNTSQKKKMLKTDAKKNLAPYRYTIAGMGTKKRFLSKHQNTEEVEP